MANDRLNPDTWHERNQEPASVKLPEYWKSEALPEPMRHPSGHNGSAVWICAEFIQALRRYRYEMDEKLGSLRKVPLHDWASHPVDAYRTAAVAIPPLRLRH